MDLVPLFVALAIVAVVVPVVSTAVLLKRQNHPPPPPPPPVPAPPSIVVEAPDDIHIYVFLDGASILRLYRQTLGATVQQEVKKTQGKTVGASPAIPGLGGVNAEGKWDEEVTTKFSPTNDPVQALGTVERGLLLKGSIASYDLTAPEDNAPVENLLGGLEADASRIGLRVPPEVQDGLRRAWRERRQQIPDLDSLRPFVRIRAEFTVEPRTADGDRALTTMSHHDSGRLQVRIECPGEHILPQLRDRDRMITATCFGKPTWHKEQRVLEILPFSIHYS